MAGLLFTSALFIASSVPSWAAAQSSADSWDQPSNVSHSGTASNPAIVVDYKGAVHVVWQDDHAKYVYTRFDGDQWTAPKRIGLSYLFDLPNPRQAALQTDPEIYTGPNPLFVAGGGDRIVAFWISSHGRLWTSSVSSQVFQYVAAWQTPGLIGVAGSFAVTTDARGEWHLAFVRTADDAPNPPGVYYTHSSNNGMNWAVPRLLYASPYLRRLGKGEASVSIATGGTSDAPHVYVAWDNRPRKQVFLTQSADNGKTWEQPALVAGPAAEAGLADPFDIQVGANEHSVMLAWQSGQPGTTCSEIYQNSSDAGTTWSAPQPLIQDLFGCAESTRFVSGLAHDPQGPLYFMTESKNQVYLAAWDGLEWTAPQPQPILSGFEEPEIHTQVIFGCRRSAWLGERLFIVGCDTGGAGDVWVTSRDLGSSASITKASSWSPLSAVTNNDLKMEAARLAGTDDGLIHAVLSQHQDPYVYYTYWDGASWSRIAPVLELPEGEAAAPAVAAGPGNELFLIAPNNHGTIYFSRAISGNAATASSWSIPTLLTTGHDGQIASADVAEDKAGTVYVAYSIAVNEQRGIYLIQSKDHGASWSQPIQVFNGAAANVDLVGAPSLLISDTGSLHLVWKVQSVGGDSVPLPRSIYYALSEDRGQTFSDAVPLVDGPVTWREIVTDGKGNLHLLWQQDPPTSVWDQVSLDGGHTWQYPQGLPDAGSPSAVTKDAAGGLHVVSVGPGSLRDWVWNDGQWKSDAPAAWSLSAQQASSVALLAAAVNNEGKMIVLLAEKQGEGDTAERTVLYSTRMIDLQPKQAATEEVAMPTAVPPTLGPATPTPKPSSTPTTMAPSVPTQSNGQTDPNQANTVFSPYTIALLPVGLLLLGILGVVIRQAARSGDQ